MYAYKQLEHLFLKNYEFGENVSSFMRGHINGQPVRNDYRENVLHYCHLSRLCEPLITNDDKIITRVNVTFFRSIEALIYFKCCVCDSGLEFYGSGGMSLRNIIR